MPLVVPALLDIAEPTTDLGEFLAQIKLLPVRSLRKRLFRNGAVPILSFAASPFWQSVTIPAALLDRHRRGARLQPRTRPTFYWDDLSMEGFSATATYQSIAVPLFVDEKPLLWVDAADRTPGDRRRVGVGLFHPEPLPHPWRRTLGCARAEGRFYYDAQDALSASRRLCELCLSIVFMAYLDLLWPGCQIALLCFRVNSERHQPEPQNSRNSRNYRNFAYCNAGDFVAMFVVHGRQSRRARRFSRLQPRRPAPKCAHVQKAQRRTTVRRTGVSKPNLVAAAVRLAGGPGAAATICGISRQTIYDWINERRVERLIDALRLSRASGVAIENLAGDDVEKLAAPVRIPHPKRRGRKTSSDSRDL
jgi:hypothetical protein